jgi:hypothetical protein
VNPILRNPLNDPVAAVAWSPDATRLAVAGISGACAVLDATSLQTLHALPGHAAGVRPFQIRLRRHAEGGRARLEEVAGDEQLQADNLRALEQAGLASRLNLAARLNLPARSR